MDFAVSAWLSRSNDWLAFGWPVENRWFTVEWIAVAWDLAIGRRS
jgi:hypothetical protein